MKTHYKIHALRIPSHVFRALDSMAHHAHKSRNAYITEVLVNHLESLQADLTPDDNIMVPAGWDPEGTKAAMNMFKDPDVPDPPWL